MNRSPRNSLTLRIEQLEAALRELLEASDIGDPNEFAAYAAQWSRAKLVLNASDTASEEQEVADA